MRYVSVELLRAWGTITRPPREGPGGPTTGVSLYVGSYIYFKLLPARDIEIRALARSRPFCSRLRRARTRDFNRAALRANRKINRHWSSRGFMVSPTRYYHSRSIITRETNDATYGWLYGRASSCDTSYSSFTRLFLAFLFSLISFPFFSLSTPEFFNWKSYQFFKPSNARSNNSHTSSREIQSMSMMII